MPSFVEVCAGCGGLSAGFMEVVAGHQKYRQIGNAVPVSMSRHLAKSLEKAVA